MAIQPVQDSSMLAVTPESSGLSEQQMQAAARGVTYAAAGALTIFAGVFLLAFPPAGAVALMAGLGVYYGLIGGIVFGPGIFEGSGDRAERIDSVRDRALGGNGPVNQDSPVNQSQGERSVPPSQQDDAEGSGSGSESSSQNAQLSSGVSSGSNESKDVGLSSVVIQDGPMLDSDEDRETEEWRSFDEGWLEFDHSLQQFQESSQKVTPKTSHLSTSVWLRPSKHEEARAFVEQADEETFQRKSSASSSSIPVAVGQKSNTKQREESVVSSRKKSKRRTLSRWDSPSSSSSESSAFVNPFPVSQKIADSSPKELEPKKMQGDENDIPESRNLDPKNLEATPILNPQVLPASVQSKASQIPAPVESEGQKIVSSIPPFIPLILDPKPSVVMGSPDSLAPSPSIVQSLKIEPFSGPGSLIGLVSSRDSSLLRQEARPTLTPSLSSPTSRRLALQSDSSGDSSGQPRSSETVEKLVRLAALIHGFRFFTTLQEIGEFYNRSKAETSNTPSRALEWKPISNPEIAQKPVAKRIHNFAKSLNALGVSQLNALMRRNPSALSLSLPLLNREILALEFELPKDTPGQPKSSQPVPESTSSISNPIVELSSESEKKKTLSVVKRSSSEESEAPKMPSGVAEEVVILDMPPAKFSELMSKGIFDQASNENFKVENLDDLKRALPYLNVDKMSKEQQNFLLNQKRFGDATNIREYVNRRISTYNAMTGKTTREFYGSYLKPEYKSYMDRLKEEYQARMKSAKPRLREFLNMGSQGK